MATSTKRVSITGAELMDSRQVNSGQFESRGGVKAQSVGLLPKEGRCNTCQDVKPIREMAVVHLRREKLYYMRPRCKNCHNKRERGHRREWKRKYLQRWRRENAAVNESYWKGDADIRERARVRAAARLKDPQYHEAILIQGRLRRHGIKVSLKEAKELLKEFGRCYPTRFGLTSAGLRECERIRSALRSRPKHRRPSSFEIRIMVYQDSPRGTHGRFFIKPSLQPMPYQNAAEKLRALQRARRLQANQTLTEKAA